MVRTKLANHVTTSSFSLSKNHAFILWNLSSKHLPHRPAKPELLPKEDEGHWYDMEYAGWDAVKENIPTSPGTGPKGKKVICLQSATDKYQRNYLRGMTEAAEQAGIVLINYFANWNNKVQTEQLNIAISQEPDLIILNPEDTSGSSKLFKKVNRAGIPIIASNFTPSNESFTYFLCWTGPDDWGQSRMLAQKFAELCDYRGEYCIIRHIKGTSSYYSRTYGVITELHKIAPEMQLLHMESTQLQEEQTYETVCSWLEKHGGSIKGIVSCDDSTVLAGINRALMEFKSENIIRVACGSTIDGMNAIREGRLHALAYQSAELDGALPLRTAVDWFNGLEIEPIRYLPKHIITAEDVDLFSSGQRNLREIDLSRLREAIARYDRGGIYNFFTGIYDNFTDSCMIDIEYFRGFCIIILSHLIAIMTEYGLKTESIFGNYDVLWRNLIKRGSLEKTLEWLIEISLNIVERITIKRESETLIQRVIVFIKKNHASPLSLKVISNEFGVSSAYLGQLFKRETGSHFTDFLHSVRIEEAKKLLKTTFLKSSEIGHMVGFENSNYFYTVFKKMSGMTPSQFIRRQHNSAI